MENLIKLGNSLKHASRTMDWCCDIENKITSIKIKWNNIKDRLWKIEVTTMVCGTSFVKKMVSKWLKWKWEWTMMKIKRWLEM